MKTIINIYGFIVSKGDDKKYNKTISKLVIRNKILNV